MAVFVYSDGFAGYDFGPQHPLRPRRLVMTHDLLGAYRMLDSTESRVIHARPAAEDDILLAHSPEYVEAVRRLSRGESVPDPASYGFAAGDNPPFAGMYEASLLYTGASVQAAEIVASGEDRTAFNVSGGLHHAMRDRASGFCIFNDPVVAIHRLLEKLDRIAYIDIDAHHGDGVQAAFYTSNRVLTVSIHESGKWLFPGTGFEDEIGDGDGVGYNVNLPLAPNSGDAELRRAFDEGALPVVHAFDPRAIVAQLGADGHYLDPLSHLNYTTEGWLRVVREILNLGPPVVALGGGGYHPSSVCRMWTLAYAAMTGRELGDRIPDEFGDRYMIRILRDRYHPDLPVPEARKAAAELNATLGNLRRHLYPYWSSLTGLAAA